MSSTRITDVVVIGGGPAGSAAACALAASGLGVTLIEQHRFPRDKVCGECLSALGIETLRELGLFERIEALAPVTLRKVALHAPDGTSANLCLPQPMWGVSRMALDAALLDAARGAGAEVLQPARCESIDGCVRVRDLSRNALRELSADWTLLADGKGVLLPDRPPRTGDLGVKIHLTQVDGPRDTIALFGVRGHYVGVAPIEGERWNAAFSVPAARLAEFNGDLDLLWGAMLQENVALRRCCGGAAAAAAWLSSPLPRFGVASRWPPRVIPLGNAAAALEPIGGEGMGLALRSAALAAEALIEAYARHAEPDVSRLRREFRKLWDARRLGCRALAKVLASPRFAGAALEWAGASESLTRVAMALAGK